MDFFATVARNILLVQGLNKTLPRNVRGMEWENRLVFERDYWKNGDEKSREVEPLDASEGVECGGEAWYMHMYDI